MGHPCLSEEVPVLALNRRLVAYRQCGQYAGRAGVADLAQDGIPHGLAQALHRVADGLIQQLGVGAALRHPHIAGGADTLLKPHQLHIKAVRIERTMRLLEPQRQAPALTGTQCAAGVGQHGLVIEIVVPAQRQLGGQLQRHSLGVGPQAHPFSPLNLKLKTQA